MTSNAKAEGRFGKQDFRYLAEEDVYVCPAGEKLIKMARLPSRAV
jgi:transposase